MVKRLRHRPLTAKTGVRFPYGSPNKKADTIDVYEAMDMVLPGMFAYRSILDDNRSKEIPNLRDPKVRDLWRNDTACTMPDAAGDMLQPTFSLGTPEIDDGVYERVRTMWEEERARKAAEEAAKK